MLKYLSLDYFVLSETKLDESFPHAQFTLDGYEIRASIELFGIYRTPSVENLANFFEEMTTSLTKVASNYENIIVM